jgi:hypothetical protein
LAGLSASGSRGFVKSLTHPVCVSTSLPARMDRRDEYRDNMSSPRSYTESQWSPPPRFQETDQIYTTDGAPQPYTPNQHSPPALSPPLHDYQQQDYQHSQVSSQTHEGYQEGYFNSPWVFRSSTFSRIELEYFYVLRDRIANLHADIPQRRRLRILHTML